MPTVDLADHYSGGYFLIRSGNPGWEQLKSELLPEKFISLSDCFSPQLNVNWGWVTGNPLYALEFGIAADKVFDFVHWCKYEHKSEMDLWGMFYSTAFARHFIERFSLSTENLYLIGAGLPRELADNEDWRNITGDDIYGIEQRILQRLPIETGGEVLGWDVISFEYGNFGHTWLCSHLHEDMNQLFGVRVNSYGLINSYDEARKIYEWIAEDDGKGTRAEPAPYDFWLVVSYPL